MSFPSSPVNGQTYTIGGKTYTYNSSKGVWGATSPNLNTQNNSGIVLFNSGNVSANISVASGYNAASVGPITINSGVQVTIATGQRWLIL
jgi:hypothetical protein